jgi:DNA-binding PadR family transcriptional regulator
MNRPHDSALPAFTTGSGPAFAGRPFAGRPFAGRPSFGDRPSFGAAFGLPSPPWVRRRAATAWLAAETGDPAGSDNQHEGHPHEGHPHDQPRGKDGRGRRGGRRFGPGFGPGGPGFGPGGPGFGPGFGRQFGPGGRGAGPGGPPWGHRRRQRGNVRAAILALLAEEPRHGYAVMNELAERSGGLWRPSPGSVYPVLAQLQDEGLVSATDADGRRVFALTDAGRAHVTEHADELREPWVVAETGPRERVQQLMGGMAGLAAAVQQVSRLGDDAQTARAVAALDEARKAMYRILAGDADPEAPRPE